MKRALWSFSSLLLLATLASAGPARAAAYYVADFGTRTLARGGANVVNPGDPSALWLNPAAITLSHGIQLQIDASFTFLPATFTRTCGPSNWCGPRPTSRTYGGDRFFVDDTRPAANDNDNFSANTPAPGTLGQFMTPSRFDDEHGVQNQALVQPVPRLWGTVNMDSFGLPGLAFGGGFWAPSAGAYQFPADETTRYTIIDRFLVEAFYGVTVAYRFGRWLAIGAGIQGATGGADQTVKLSADLYGNERPDYDILTHIEGYQHLVPTANFGVWSSPVPGLELGASVQLGRRYDVRGQLAIEELGPGVQELIDEELVALDIEDPTARLTFQMPPFYRAGVKYGRDGIWDTFGFDLEVAVVMEQWSVFDRVKIDPDGVSFSLGGGDPAPLPAIIQPKDYRDSWSLRTGGSVWVWERFLELHGGMFYETAAIPSETLSVELLNGQKIGVGTGASFSYWGVRLDVGYSYLAPLTWTDEGPFLGRIVGDESVVYNENSASLGGETRTRVAMGRYDFSYHMLSVSLNLRFDEMLGFGVVDKAPWEKPLLPFL